VKRTVALLVAALLGYVALIGYRGVYLLGSHRPALKILGVAALVLPLIGLWLVAAEIRFGRAIERLARRLPAADDPPLPRTPSGRVDRAAADARFEQRRSEVEAAPDDWRTWYRLAIAYDDAGDRRRARNAMRTALEKAS
jgi:tetratricopeptide (TPR) repeat protein